MEGNLGQDWLLRVLLRGFTNVLKCGLRLPPGQTPLKGKPKAPILRICESAEKQKSTGHTASLDAAVPQSVGTCFSSCPEEAMSAKCVVAPGRQARMQQVTIGLWWW
jgi:hypothetical protein